MDGRKNFIVKRWTDPLVNLQLYSTSSPVCCLLARGERISGCIIYYSFLWTTRSSSYSQFSQWSPVLDSTKTAALVTFYKKVATELGLNPSSPGAHTSKRLHWSLESFDLDAVQPWIINFSGRIRQGTCQRRSLCLLPSRGHAKILVDRA